MDLMFGAASGLKRQDPDYEACLVANAALGQSSLSSRLGKRVRDTEGLTYSIYSRFTMTDFLDGIWLADVAVAPSNLGKAMKSTREVIEGYCKNGITEEEVLVQKSFLRGQLPGPARDERGHRAGARGRGEVRLWAGVSG